jgi:hypothetical protein
VFFMKYPQYRLYGPKAAKCGSLTNRDLHLK